MPLFVGASESYDTDAWEAYNLKKENAKLRELVRDAWGDGHPDRSCEGCDIRDEYPNAESIDDIDPDDFNGALKNHEN